MTHTTNSTTITLTGALAVIHGVTEAAASERVNLGVVVLDASGLVVASARMDGCQLPALELAASKAYTAAAFSAPSEAFAGSTVPGSADWGMNGAVGGRLLTMAGGLPVVVDGRMVGAVGVSGAAAHVDRRCAEAGIEAAFGTSTPADGS